MNRTDATPAIDWLAHCCAEVRRRLLQNGPQLNADKSEVVVLGTAVAAVPTVYSTGRVATLGLTHTHVSTFTPQETSPGRAITTSTLCATCAVY